MEISEQLRKICTTSLIFVLCISYLVCHCNRAKETTDYRIVSLSPAMTEILFALGSGNNIVGVTTFCDYPEEAKKIYKIGDFSNPSVERIVGLKPNLVILNLPEQMRIKKQLERLKINIFVSSPSSLDEVYEEITEIGKIVKREHNADSLVNYMRTNIVPVENKKKTNVYIELSPRPIVTIGKHSFLNELLELAGAGNVFADLNKDYPVVSQEEIIKRNPEIIILLHPENIEQRTGWGTIAAVKNKRVYADINQDYIMRPAPRLVKGFKELKRIILE